MTRNLVAELQNAYDRIIVNYIATVVHDYDIREILFLFLENEKKKEKSPSTGRRSKLSRCAHLTGARNIIDTPPRFSLYLVHLIRTMVRGVVRDTRVGVVGQ